MSENTSESMFKRKFGVSRSAIRRAKMTTRRYKWRERRTSKKERREVVMRRANGNRIQEFLDEELPVVSGREYRMQYCTNERLHSNLLSNPQKQETKVLPALREFSTNKQ